MMLLAVSAILLSTGITTIISLQIPDILKIESAAARFYVAIMFGAILTTTDPVAVVTLLKELGKHRKIFFGPFFEKCRLFASTYITWQCWLFCFFFNSDL